MSRVIVLEGPDGCGKSTTARAIKNVLEQEHQRSCVVLRAPGTTRLGEELRKILLDPQIHADPEELALMFMASIASVTREAIRIVQEQDTFVVLDRWIFSMMVYQGEAGVARHKLEALTKMFMPDPGEVWIDAYLLSVPFEECIKRLREADDRGNDRFEGEGKAVAKKRWMAYESFPDRELQRIPCNHSVEKIARAIIAGVEPQ